MAELPTGTVTFLFTDIEGSTRLTRTLGDRWPAVLEDHRTILRRAIRDHGGVDLRTEGDAFFAVFSSAVEAVAATAEAQRSLAGHPWPVDDPIRVRMGMHTGEGRLAGEDYVGLDVHHAARIAAAGHGGQVLLSRAALAAAKNALPAGVSTRDLGPHRLKDFDEPQPIHQLVITGLPSDFPPIRSLEIPTKLPLQLTTFVGRERELTQAIEVLGRGRLVTFTGPGGTGKTRLAVEVAARVSERFADGVYFVDLSPIREPRLLANTIGSALQVREEAGRAVAETLSYHLRDRTMLLVLDNFEQILPAADLVTALLRAAPRLQVLVTSRIRLGLAGEQELSVPPMNLPDDVGDAAALLRNEAVELFTERARAVDREFELTEESAPIVAQICSRLDGLPLAIELAASRIKVLHPRSMLERLDRRLSLLVGGPRDAPDRQRTLRAAIAWSYDLLDDRTAAFFRRLGVFAGGWSLEMADAVANPGADLGDTVDLMELLLEQSLIRRDANAPDDRFRMLETIREFALEALEDSGDGDKVRRRHAARFLDLAEEAETHLSAKDQRLWIDLLTREHDNLRAALGWALEANDGETGLHLAGSLWRFWQVASHLEEGRRRLEALLALPSRASRSAARAKGLTALGGVAYWQNDLHTALAAYEESLAISRELGDRPGSVRALFDMGTARGVTGDLDTGMALLQESLGLAREVGDRRGEGWALWGLGTAHWFRGDVDDARRYLEESLPIFEEVGDEWGVNSAITGKAVSMAVGGDPHGAIALILQTLEGAEEEHNEMSLSNALDILAGLAEATGHPQRAVTLGGASAALKDKAGGGAPGAFSSFPDPRETAAATLDQTSIDRAWAEGFAMTFDEMLAFARETPQP